MEKKDVLVGCALVPGIADLYAVLQTCIMKLMPLFLCLLLLACDRQTERIHLPSKKYIYAAVDTAALSIRKKVYVPVYSHIYMVSGQQVQQLTATLSIRNTSYRDTFYISDVVYYGSQGEVLKRYLDSTLLLPPMHSVEYVVEQEESKGGAGANFVVGWGARQAVSKPLVQAVMVGARVGGAFICEGVEME